VTGTVHINTRIRQNAETLAAALEGHMQKIFAPDARKELRLFSAGEAAELLGISTSFLRKLHFDDKAPEVHTSPGGRRQYSADDLLELRRILEAKAMNRGAYQRVCREGDKVHVLSIPELQGRVGHMARWGACGAAFGPGRLPAFYVSISIRKRL